MKSDYFLLKNKDCVDSVSVNRCFQKLFEYAKGISSKYVESTSENVPEYPYFKDGYLEYPISDSPSSSPEMVKYGLLSSTDSRFGLVERMYGGALDVETYAGTCAVTESTTGTYSYSPSYVMDRFVPSVKTLFSNTYPLVFASLLGSESAVKFASGTSVIESEFFPKVKYTSYLLCSGIGISFGTIEFDSENGDAQRNTMVIDVVSDLVHVDSVRSIEFISFGNGMGSGVREVSEDLDMVEEMCSAQVTYLDKKKMRVAVSNITKNGPTGSIRVDKATSRILDDNEEAEFGTYTKLSNDTFSIGFFVVFGYEPPTIAFTNASVSLGVGTTRSDYSYFMYCKKYYDGTALTLSRFEMLDNSEHGSRTNTVTNASFAFCGCTNATFSALEQFSSGLTYAESCFDGCTKADFASLVELYMYTIKNARRMFAGCVGSRFSSLQSINLPSIDDASEMFCDCTDATFPVLDTIVTCGNSDRMFYGCRSSLFSNTRFIQGAIASAKSAFCECDSARFSSLRTITTSYLGSADFSCMFLGCEKGSFDNLRSISASGSYCGDSMFDGDETATFFSLTSIGNVTSAKRMFAGCRSSSFSMLSSLGNGKLVDAGYMFDGCRSTGMELTGCVSSVSVADCMFRNCRSVRVHGSSEFSSLKSAESMFDGCTYASVSSDFDGVTYAGSMFANCMSADVHADFPSLSDGSGMFSGTENVYVDGDFGSVAAASNMFGGCSSVRISNGSSFGSLSDGGGMFQGAQSIEIFGGFDGLILGRSMFENCCSVSITGDLGRLRDGELMFSGCGHISMSTASMSSLSNGTGMFRWCPSVSVNGSLTSLSVADTMFMRCGSVVLTGEIGNSMTSASGMFANCSSVRIGTLKSSNSPSNYSHAFYRSGSISVTGCGPEFLKSVGDGSYMFYDSRVERFGTLADSTSLDFSSLRDGSMMFSKNDLLGFGMLTSVSITVPNGIPSANYCGMFSNMDPEASLSSLESVSVSSSAQNTASVNMSRMFSNEDSASVSNRLRGLKSVSIRTAGEVDIREMFRGSKDLFSANGLESFACRHSDGERIASQTGYAARAFAGCSEMRFVPRSLYLPVSPSVGNESECYGAMFSGVKASSIDLSLLTEETTNIHALGYLGRKTDARKLFSGIDGASITTPQAASTAIGLSLDIANQMDWGVRYESPKILSADEIVLHSILAGGRVGVLEGELVTNHSLPDIKSVTMVDGEPKVFAARMSYPNSMSVSAYFDGDDRNCRVDIRNDGIREHEGIDIRCTLLYRDTESGKWTTAKSSTIGLYRINGGACTRNYTSLGKAASGIRYCAVYETDEFSEGMKGEAFVTMACSDAPNYNEGAGYSVSDDGLGCC